MKFLLEIDGEFLQIEVKEDQAIPNETLQGVFDGDVMLLKFEKGQFQWASVEPDEDCWSVWWSVVKGGTNG